MEHSIAKNYNTRSLLKFALPTVVMMLVMSMYTIVDGIFVSRYVGTDALSAVNLVYPFLSIIVGIGVMLGTGGNAIVAKLLGEGKKEKARYSFTLLITAGVIAGLIIGIIGILFASPIIRGLGAGPAFFDYGKEYLVLLLFFTPANILQLLFQSFLVTEGKPGLGLTLTISAGITNAVLDYLFMGVLSMGIMGAALGTAIGYMIPTIYGLYYFSRKKAMLRFTKLKWDRKILTRSCLNGSSEMVSQLAGGVVTFLFNIMMLRYIGEDGVAAITAVLYSQFLFNAIFIGFSNGIAPIISYNYGSGNTDQLKRIFKICIKSTVIFSFVAVACALAFSSQLVSAFFPKGSDVYNIALNGFYIFALNYLVAGINIFASALFTALSNGKVSAAISFLRTFGFIFLGAIILPPAFSITGIWLIVPFSEILTLLVSLFFLKVSPKQVIA